MIEQLPCEVNASFPCFLYDVSTRLPKHHGHVQFLVFLFAAIFTIAEFLSLYPAGLCIVSDARRPSFSLFFSILG